MSHKVELTTYYNTDIHKKLSRPINCLKLNEPEVLLSSIEVISSPTDAFPDSWTISLTVDAGGN
jgi:hypothetical protein